jgi:hypothetical protein
MESILFIAFGIAVGYVASRYSLESKLFNDKSFCVYTNKSGERKLARLAQALRLNDEYAVVVSWDVVKDEAEHMPFVVASNAVRFYTRNGDVVNAANWKE